MVFQATLKLIPTNAMVFLNWSEVITYVFYNLKSSSQITYVTATITSEKKYETPHVLSLKHLAHLNYRKVPFLGQVWMQVSWSRICFTTPNISFSDFCHRKAKLGFYFDEIPMTK